LIGFKFVIIFFCSFYVQADEAKVTQAPLYVEWYKPEIKFTERKNRSRVRLTGLTEPNANIKISNAEIPVIKKSGKIESLIVTDVTGTYDAYADERGIFEIDLDLSQGNAQIPITVTGKDGKFSAYQLALIVSKRIVSIKNLPKAKVSPYARRTWGLWLGLGYNYLTYDQKVSEVPSSLKLESLEGPTLFAKVAKSLSPTIAFQSTLNQAPGKTKSSPAVTISKGSYDWTYYTAEFTYFKPSWSFHLNKYFNELGAQAGLQYHSVPFFTRSSTTDPTAAQVVTNDILFAAFGGTWLIHYDRYWLFETFLRVQLPVYTGDVFDIDSAVAFDGSMGVIYKMKPDWRVGVFWYGQQHNYKFSNHNDKFFEANGGGGPKVSGSQDLFYSNLEFRIGWEFD
jgi:hypothetical protein